MTVRKAEFREIFVRNEQSAWCRLLWQATGQVIILSDYGHWAHWWGHRGEGVSVPEFLVSLDRDYMGKKMMGQSLLEFDLKSTVQTIREAIICYRKTDDLSKIAAADEWELVKSLEDGDLSFELWCHESSLTDGYEYRRTEVCNTWDCFWHRLWLPLVVPALRAECGQPA